MKNVLKSILENNPKKTLMPVPKAGSRAGAAILAAVLLLAGTPADAAAKAGTETKTATVTEKKTEGQKEEKKEAGHLAGMPNPWRETDDLQEACEGSGIDFDEPIEAALPQYKQMKKSPYRYTDDMIEILYTGENDELVVRVSRTLGGFDLTGDYNTYSAEWDENFKGLIAHCRGDGSTINAAVFDCADVHFAVLCNSGREGEGLTSDQLKSLVMGMQAVVL